MIVALWTLLTVFTYFVAMFQTPRVDIFYKSQFLLFKKTHYLPVLHKNNQPKSYIDNKCYKRSKRYSTAILNSVLFLGQNI